MFYILHSLQHFVLGVVRRTFSLFLLLPYLTETHQINDPQRKLIVENMKTGQKIRADTNLPHVICIIKPLFENTAKMKDKKSKFVVYKRPFWYWGIHSPELRKR